MNIPSSLAWRLPYALQALIALGSSVATLMLLPESPRWLNACGRREQALAVWERLGLENTEREKIEETENSELTKVRMKDILAIFGKDVLRQTALGVFLMGMQQLSGIDGVLYVCPHSQSLSND